MLLRKVTTPVLKSMRNQWPLYLCQLLDQPSQERPFLWALPAVRGHEWRPPADTMPQQVCTPYGGMSCWVSLILLMVEERKPKANIQYQCKGLTVTVNEIVLCPIFPEFYGYLRQPWYTPYFKDTNSTW